MSDPHEEWIAGLQERAERAEARVAELELLLASQTEETRRVRADLETSVRETEAAHALRVLSADLPTDPADERIVDALVADKTPEGRPMRARLDSDGTTQPPHVDSAKAKDEP